MFTIFYSLSTTMFILAIVSKPKFIYVKGYYIEK